jgi:hypothetical protein
MLARTPTLGYNVRLREAALIDRESTGLHSADCSVEADLPAVLRLRIAARSEVRVADHPAVGI